MIIRSDLRPTMIRTNARHRGPSESYQYSNYIGEVIHDLMLLGKVMDQDESKPEAFTGHSNYILGNLGGYITGQYPVTSNIQDAAKLIHVKDHLYAGDNKLADQLSSSLWTPYGNCVKSATGNKAVISSPGTDTPSGIGTQIMVEEGQVIFIRMAVRLMSGDGTAFAIGSHNINQGKGDVKNVKLTQNGATIFIDKRLYCQHREPITINIDVQYLPGKLGAGQMEISDLEIRYATENELTLGPLDTYLKPKVNLLEETVNNIMRNV